jgi:spectinomycin phosphotransferase
MFRAAGHLRLVDWDTAGLAVPERDLWMHADAAGRRADADAIALYRIRWRLDDIAAFAVALRAPHSRNPDTERALVSLGQSLDPDFDVNVGS